MKRLFDDKERMTGAGREVARRVEEALTPIVQYALDHDLSLRDVEYIIHNAAISSCLAALAKGRQG